MKINKLRNSVSLQHKYVLLLSIVWILFYTSGNTVLEIIGVIATLLTLSWVLWASWIGSRPSCSMSITACFETGENNDDIGIHLDINSKNIVGFSIKNFYILDDPKYPIAIHFWRHEYTFPVPMNGGSNKSIEFYFKKPVDREIKKFRIYADIGYKKPIHSDWVSMPD